MISIVGNNWEKCPNSNISANSKPPNGIYTGVLTRGLDRCFSQKKVKIKITQGTFPLKFAVANTLETMSAANQWETVSASDMHACYKVVINKNCDVQEMILMKND